MTPPRPTASNEPTGGSAGGPRWHGRRRGQQRRSEQECADGRQNDNRRLTRNDAPEGRHVEPPAGQHGQGGGDADEGARPRNPSCSEDDTPRPIRRRRRGHRLVGVRHLAPAKRAAIQPSKPLARSDPGPASSPRTPILPDPWPEPASIPGEPPLPFRTERVRRCTVRKPLWRRRAASGFRGRPAIRPIGRRGATPAPASCRA